LHTWIGDSREVLPQLYVRHPLLKFDAIHVDGGHSGGIALADMSNALRMARSDAYFIVDDIPCTAIANAFSDVFAAGFLRRSSADAGLERTPYHEIVRVV
jgi:hypothetical protein